MTDPASIQAQVRAARQKQIPPVDLPIPGYDKTLWGTFKAVEDYKLAREINERHQDSHDEATQELLVAADTFLETCVDVFVPQDGFVAGEDHDKFSLGMTLGAELARWLDLEGADNPGLTDAEAVFLIFPNTISIAELATEFNEHMKSGGRKAEVKLAGNSPAPSLPNSVQPAPSSKSPAA